MKKLIILIFNFIIILYEGAIASSGPLAEGFGAQAWLDKIHVVLGVIALVTLITVFLIYLILRK